MEKNFIYTLAHPVTGEIRYIGKTNNLKRRFSQHLSNHGLLEKSKKNNWIISLLKQKIVPIMEILEETTDDNINELEIFYISLFKSWNFRLLNMTDGGDSGYMNKGRVNSRETTMKKIINNPNRRSVGQYDLQNNLIREYHSVREAEKELLIARSTICSVCKGKRKTAGRFIWKYIDRINNFEILEQKKINLIKYNKPKKETNYKKIKVFNLKGELLELCDSMNQVVKKYNCHRELIQNCCDKKNYYQTKNLTFRYENDVFDYVPYKNYRNNRTYKIGLFNKEGDLIQEFKSLKEACNYSSFCKKTITDNCKKNLDFPKLNHETKNGFIFKFLENPYE
jgi:hypothetical protein